MGGFEGQLRSGLRVSGYKGKPPCGMHRAAYLCVMLKWALFEIALFFPILIEVIPRADVFLHDNGFYDMIENDGGEVGAPPLCFVELLRGLPQGCFIFCLFCFGHVTPLICEHPETESIDAIHAAVL